MIHAIDDTGDIWNDFAITSQPAWAFVNDDGKIETNIGALGESALLDRIDKLQNI